MNDTAFVLTLAASIIAAVPIALAALGELLAERSGVLNLGVEGMMLVGAVLRFPGRQWHRQYLDRPASSVRWPAAGSPCSMPCCRSRFRANQIVSGLSLTIFGTGLATFVGKSIEGVPLAADFRPTAWGPLADIPVIGPMFFDQDPIVYVTIGSRS